MKRYLLSLALILACSLASIAQAYEGTVEYSKKKQQAFVIDYAYSPEAVENALVQKIEKLGYSSKTEKGLFNKDKGFIVFRNTVISEIDAVSHDYVLKVEKKSRKETDAATLYLIVLNDDSNVLPSMNTDQVAKAKYFLNNLLPEIEEAKLELEIKDNEESVSKSEKKFKDLQDEKADLEKKLRRNADDLDKQQKQIENQRLSLDALKGKRKGAVTVPASSN